MHETTIELPAILYSWLSLIARLGFPILVLVGHYKHVEEGQRLNPLAEPVPMRQPVIMTLNPYPS